MTTEQPLYFTENAFGTCDAISFRKKKLRIHDLKTGVTKANMNQLRVYAALFCLEYNIKPSAIEIELRIYQNDDIIVEIPEVEDIIYIMDRLRTFDALIEELKQEEVR